MSNVSKKIDNFGAICVTYGVMFVEGSLSALIVALMSILTQKFSVTATEITMLLTVKSIGTLSIMFFGGYLSDKYGRKLPISIGTVLFLIFIGGFYLTDNYKVALVLTLLSGIAHGLTDTPGMSLLFDAMKGNTGPALSLVQVFFSGGAALTTFVTSIFIKNDIDYHWILIIIFVINILVIILVHSITFPSLSGSVESDKRIILFKREPSFKREGVLLLFVTFFSSSYSSVISTWTPTYMNEIKGMEISSSLAALSSYQLGAIIGAFAFAIILKKNHSTRVLTANAIVSLLIFSGIKVAINPTIIKVLLFSLGFFMGISFSLSINMGGELFFKRAGTITGIVGSTSMVAGTAMVWVTGQMLSIYSVALVYNIAFISLICIVVTSILMMLNYNSLVGGKNEKNRYYY